MSRAQDAQERLKSIGSKMTCVVGNLAMSASCERAAGAGCRGGKLSRVRSSQPLGSVMSGRRERSGQINEGSEVKGVCPESDT
jgi:hypothetical protein